MSSRGRAADDARDTPTEPTLAWLGPAGADLRPLARIWATVEMERALADLGVSADRAATAAIDPLLGARVVTVTDDDGTLIAVAEPSTEGRLAAVLARGGEGPAGRYVVAPVGLSELRALAAAAGVLLSSPVDGPFGPSVLIAGGAIGAPILVLVEPAAVPSRP